MSGGLKQSPPERDGRVQHAARAETAAAAPTASPNASCARCGAPLPRTKSGSIKAGIRFCREACRLADVRNRRAAARASLAQALQQLRIQLDRAEDALATLGLLPRQRARKVKGDG
jgi:hypothetical protein